MQHEVKREKFDAIMNVDETPIYFNMQTEGSVLFIEYLRSCLPNEWRGKKILLINDLNSGYEQNMTIFQWLQNVTHVTQPQC